ncbi:MAG TPA: PTS sugar transporter subunit IIA [Anaerolineae bacterium]|nr:PTS sugar transporter subunit IIA [Anaerolineae bacterium]HOQ99863.1 PTS sugar transporter subunit IIA [Anaerolineae bacterium]
MDILRPEMIQLGGAAGSKEEAIRLAGALLVRGGCVEPAYVAGMLAREETMSTCLGNGVSIPHGQFDDRSLIHRTGLSVLQLAQGIEWEPGELVYLVIGIAATSDEHIGILARLAEALEDEETTQTLFQATEPATIIECLSHPPQP